MIVWTGRETYDPDTMSKVFQVKVGDESISVWVSQETLDDIDLGKIRTVAEGKILAETANGIAPKKVLVTTADFRA